MSTPNEARQPADELPWDDLKVAFGVADDEAVWNWLDGGRLPIGWTLCETDGSGARCVAVFRVEGRMPTREAGMHVAELLSHVDARFRREYTPETYPNALPPVGAQ